MYNPSSSAAITNDAQQFEYIELKNMTDVHFRSGRHALTIESVPIYRQCRDQSGSRTDSVLVGTKLHLPRGINSVQCCRPFQGVLDNGSETIRLEDAAGKDIPEIAYDHGWYPSLTVWVSPLSLSMDFHGVGALGAARRAGAPAAMSRVLPASAILSRRPTAPSSSTKR